MEAYLVICNGKISGKAYSTLKQAQEFCETQGAKQNVNNAWIYTTDEDIYMITNVQVMMSAAKNDAPVADIVKVVRCKDCKYRPVDGLPYQSCPMWDSGDEGYGAGWNGTDNGFCYYGEPRR